MSQKGKGRGRPNGHRGAYLWRPRTERALERLQVRLSNPPSFPEQALSDAWLASSRAEEAALRKRLNK